MISVFFYSSRIVYGVILEIDILRILLSNIKFYIIDISFYYDFIKGLCY